MERQLLLDIGFIIATTGVVAIGLGLIAAFASMVRNASGRISLAHAPNPAVEQFVTSSFVLLIIGMLITMLNSEGIFRGLFAVIIFVCVVALGTYLTRGSR
ncbi:MAG: hypothetical protein ABA06_03495 [Parcubacteria bacterium C7867-001]|nr:MAG: hypothetical protein ABA06_03495 [Parcubacteria bacterium C7867-001]